MNSSGSGVCCTHLHSPLRHAGARAVYDGGAATGASLPQGGGWGRWLGLRPGKPPLGGEHGWMGPRVRVCVYAYVCLCIYACTCVGCVPLTCTHARTQSRTCSFTHLHPSVRQALVCRMHGLIHPSLSLCLSFCRLGLELLTLSLQAIQPDIILRLEVRFFYARAQRAQTQPRPNTPSHRDAPAPIDTYI